MKLALLTLILCFLAGWAFAYTEGIDPDVARQVWAKQRSKFKLGQITETQLRETAEYYGIDANAVNDVLSSRPSKSAPRVSAPRAADKRPARIESPAPSEEAPNRLDYSGAASQSSTSLPSKSSGVATGGVSNSAPADANAPPSCQHQDLRGQSWMTPVRHQSQHGWCFAYAMADLFSYRAKQPVSAAALAISTSYDQTKAQGVEFKRTDGADLREVFASAKKHDLCTEGSVISTTNKGGQIDKLKDRYDAIVGSPGSKPCMDAIKEVFPKVAAEDVSNIIKTVTGDKLLLELSNKSCHQLPAGDAHFTQTYDRAKGLQMTNAALDRGEPIGVSYRPGLVASDSLSGPDHGSTVVGREWRDGKCWYLIRNSWGSECGYYPKEANCKNGHFWVPEEKLMKSTSFFGLSDTPEATRAPASPPPPEKKKGWLWPF